jgi:hypothetical protein
MKLEIGKFPSKPYGAIMLPKILIGIAFRPRSETTWWWHFGRLYRGYVGIMGIAWRFHFDLWIHNMEGDEKWQS